MIQSIRLQNFQSHKDSYLRFSNGINIISGQSNNGKTSLLRGLNWVITNRPQGIAFKSIFSDKKEICRVSLIINDTLQVSFLSLKLDLKAIPCGRLVITQFKALRIAVLPLLDCPEITLIPVENSKKVSL